MFKSLCAALLCLIVVGAALAQDSTQTYNGHLDDSTEFKDYKVGLHTGDAVMITAKAQSNDNLDTTLTLYAPNGDQVAENDDAGVSTYDSRITYIAEQTGSYRVRVSRYDKTTSGGYELVILTGNQDIFNYDVTLSGPMLTRDTDHFRFHYTERGSDAITSDFLDAMARAFEVAYRIEVQKMGWPAPPSDDLMGGNSLYDVYVTDLIGSGEQALGYTSPELLIGDNPNTPAVETDATTSYINIDNNFQNIDLTAGQDAVTVMRSTAIHEFNHALQMGLDGLEPQTWLAEATSSWMETAAAGKDQDATGYVAQAFDYPELCLGTTGNDGSVMYGEWTFMQFLTDEFGKNAVLDLWKQIANYDGFDAVQHYLQDNNTNLTHEVARYRLNNLARNYKLAPLFNDTVWLEGTDSHTGTWTPQGDGVQELGANYIELNVPHGSYDVSLHDDGGQLDLWAVGVASDGLEATDLGHEGGVDTQNYQHTYLMVFNPTYDNNVDQCSYTTYRIAVASGAATINPVDGVFSKTYFQPLH